MDSIAHVNNRALMTNVAKRRFRRKFDVDMPYRRSAMRASREGDDIDEGRTLLLVVVVIVRQA
jgi:hypothetical protein